MRLAKFWPGSLTILFFVGAIPAAAQLAPAPPDPLAGIRAAAQSNAQACSATGETLCEQVAPKIIANAMGESPLADNFRRLAAETDERAIGATATARTVAWGLAAFRDAGVDVHTEKYSERNGGLAEQENVVAEIRGREKPEEWVLVGAQLPTRVPGPYAVDNNCDPAILTEAARDIFLTGIRPRRSIRFVLFTGDEKELTGSWAYVRAHRAELDGARAAIFLLSGCDRVNGYMLRRPDIEPGLLEATKPIKSFAADRIFFGGPFGAVNLDFFLEGVPTLIAVASSEQSNVVDDPIAATGGPDKIDIADLKRNTAIVAVTAFGIAERAAPLGPRQSRAEIESELKIKHFDEQMKTTGLWWPLWVSGERGRQP